MQGRKAWLALAMGLGMVGAATACDVGVDPAAKIIVVSGGTMIEEPNCGSNPPSVAKIIMNEGDTLVLDTVPVNDSCTQLSGWDKLIKTSGTLKLSEMFGSDPMGLVSFVANGEEAPGHPFQWSITGSPSGVIAPTSGNTPESLGDMMVDIGGSAFDPNDPDPPPANPGNYKIIPATSGGPQGRLVVALSMGVPVRTIYHVNKLAGNFGDVSAYDAIAPSGTHIGYNANNNTEILSNQGTMQTGGQISVAYDTPTFREGAPDWGEIHYSVVGEVSIPWGFENVDIPIGICQYDDPQPQDTDGDGDIDGDDDPPPASSCQPIGDAHLLIQGVIYHKGSISGAAEGHPGAAIIAVQDISPPIAGDSGMATGMAQAGRPPVIDPIEVTAWDNNPRAQPEDFELHAWYLVERSVWGRDGTAGSEGQLGLAGDPATYHAAYADDTFAASPGHAFRWVKAGVFPGDSVTPVAGPDGSPVGVEITFPGFLPEEPTGTHFVEGVAGGGDYATYVDDGLKMVYRLVDFNSLTIKGHPDADPALDTLDPGLDVAQGWSDEIPEGYVTGGGPQVEALNDGIADPFLLDECAACNDRAILAGLPTWGVQDDLPPSLVLIAHDKKYDKVYYFGHTMLGDANCGGGTGCNGDGLNQRYLDARQAGTISSPEDENMTIQPWTPTKTVFDDESAFDYAAQRGEYLATFFPAALNYYDETYPGLWIDEDTRVEFFVTAWDNAEGWRVNGPSGGKLGGGVDLGQISFELYDEPTAGGLVMSEPGTYLFRNPNRPDDLGRAYVKVRATDINAQSTEFEVDIFIADNSLKIYSLEESRTRLSND